MSLFVLASKDGWVDIMYDGLDAVGVDKQVSVPSEDTYAGGKPSERVILQEFCYLLYDGMVMGGNRAVPLTFGP